MNPEVLIISKKHEPALKHLYRALREQEIELKSLMHSREALEALDTTNFKGFFIFCLPPVEIRYWLDKLEKKFLNQFKIYTYDYLIADDLDCSLFLMFDYIIAGEQEYNRLVKHLQYLKSNYWRKIPITKLGLQTPPGSELIWKLFHLLERSDINSTNLDKVSEKLHVSHQALQREIRIHLHLQYTELKFALVKHYQEYLNNNIVKP